ncbi:MAG TPA: hypothetical protein VFZ24_14830 [Longimicrobiales bacterium]
MSLTQPPPPDPADDTDRPPSRRFRILFGSAMFLIAIGYMWVWQAKTARVVTEEPPVLALAGTRAEPADSPRLADLLLVALDTIPTLTVIAVDSARADAAGAEQLLFAELDSDATGHRLTLRRTDLIGDSVLHVYRVEGRTVDDAVYRMAVQVAMSFGLPRPAPPTDGPDR